MYIYKKKYHNQFSSKPFTNFRVVALPLGRYFNIRETPPRRPVSQPVLEQHFKLHKRIVPAHNVVQVSNDLNT